MRYHRIPRSTRLKCNPSSSSSPSCLPSPPLSHAPQPRTTTVTRPSNPLNCAAGRSSFYAHLRSSAQVVRCTPGGPLSAEQAPPPLQEVDKLSAFLTWLLANGVQGIGGGESKVGLYEAEGGERGMASMQDIKQGDVLLRIPLRMALTDFPEDQESNEIMYQGAPWSVRLAAKLLREVERGIESPWFPYLQVLPACVPAPLETMTWEQMSKIEYTPVQNALHEYQWLVSSSYEQCSPESIGHASLEQYQWAMSLVHSRTFGNAAKEGGVGVRMLVPLVDMFNHGGDETAGLLSDPFLTTDSVRWDVVAPPEEAGASATGAAGWEMVVTATQDVPPGCALLLSYGERSGDDFFLHYGFVPPLNPHEAVQIFADLEEALDWHYKEYGHTTLTEEQAVPVYQKALKAAQKVQAEGPAASAPANKPPSVMAMAGGKVDAALITAFMEASTPGSSEEEKSRMAELAVSRRSWQLIGGMPTPLTVDAAALWADAVRTGNVDQAPNLSLVLQHYHAEINKAGLGQAILPPSASESEFPTDKMVTKQLAPKYLEGADKDLTAAPLAPATRLILQLRCAKKQLLWDLILNAKASSQELGPLRSAQQADSPGEVTDTGVTA